MKDVVVWYENTKEFVERGNRRWGADLEIKSPYEHGFNVVYETESDDGENWTKEFELEVQNKVWLEEFRWGGALERVSEEMFIHKDVFNRELSDDEKKFLNPYRNRFLLIRDEGKLCIYDMRTRQAHLMEKQSTSFKDFKAELKRLDLI